MSVSYAANAVIGISIPLSDLVETKREKMFDHDYSEEWSHDPKSGKELWRTVDVPKDGVVEDYEGEGLSSGGKVCGYDTIVTSDEDVIICLMRTPDVEDQKSHTYVKFPHGLDELPVVAMKEKLQSKGFWREETFGLHAVTRVWY